MGEKWPSGLLGAWHRRGGDPRPHTSPFPVLQFELSTISVAACPPAPLGFALFSNWVEIRLDSHEFVHDYWGPVAESAQGTGIWLLLLETMAHLSVVVNVSKGRRRGGNTRSGQYGDQRLRRRLRNREMEAEAGNQGRRLGSRGRGRGPRGSGSCCLREWVWTQDR